MIDLNKEAEEFRESLSFPPDGIVTFAFTSGANSKYVQAKIIQAQIDVLNKTKTYFDVSKLDVYEQKHHIRFTSIIIDQMEKLQQKLKQLENE
jgi:hypothetical protein